MIRFLFFLPFFFVSAAWAQTPGSFYSTTADKFVATVESSEFEDDPVIDHFRAICPGYGGYELLFEGGDARSWINIKYGDVTSDLRQVTMDAAAGMFPGKANDIVEWRGIVRDKSFIPYAIIYRIEAGKPASDETFTKLLVIALDQGKAKLLGAFQGEKAGQKARALADAQAQRDGPTSGGGR